MHICYLTPADQIFCPENQLFASDVNSPLKQQNQQQQQSQQSKDGNQGTALNGRKQSVSQSLTSPSGAPRPAARRRETTDTNPFSGGGGLVSPTGAGPGRLDMQSWFGRKGAENKEGEILEEEKPTVVLESATRPAGFNGLTRSSTTGASGFSASSLWAAAASPTPTNSAFGGFGNFNLNTPTVAPEKGFASNTGGSRFFSKKESSENVGAAGGGPAATATAPTNPGQSWRSRPRTDTDPFGADEGLSGSAALGGARDTSPPPMPTAHGSQIFDTPAKGNASDFGMSGLNLGGPREQNASSASPSQTNPYRSPPAERGDSNELDDLGFDRGHPTGPHSEQNSNFGSIRGFPAAAAAFDGSDRSQTSSVGAKNYPSLGNITGWPAPFATATPDRERAGFGNAFGNSVFSPMTNEVQSPGLGNMGGLFGPTTGGTVGLGGSGSVRGSKLTSLFPTGMQLQMQNQEHESMSDSIPDLRQSNPLGAIGAGTIGLQSRDTESPLPMGRGFMDMFPPAQPPTGSNPGVLTSAEHNPALLATAAAQGHAFGATSQGAPFSPDQGTGGPPQSQARTMVMPDRMRWVYMDPQGTQQGPFTGLDMNEWYKANFFTNDLRVRKLEDLDFEPLGQLIRRIGNSREPFLVPQVGIPHGPPPPSGQFTQGGDSRGVVPPLLGIVPSYGKTLTAEEQNNLERRKQEEQLAMARQREFAAQHNHYRNMHPGVPTGVQHQASMHSLSSQPSFGSITSPIGMTPHAPIGAAPMGVPTPGFFDQTTAANKGPSLPGTISSGPEHLRGDVHEHERQMLANYHGPGGVSGMFPPQPVGAPAADLKSQLPNVDQLERDPQGFKDRLKEFQEYQGIPTEQHHNEEAHPGLSPIGHVPGQPEAAAPPSRDDAAQIQQDEDPVQQQPHDRQPLAPKADVLQQPHSPPQQEMVMSLTQQVQKAQQNAAHAAQKKVQEDEAWARQSAATGLPMPFPPPPPSSNTPLPAPTAQRRANIADQYIDTRSQSHTPDSADASSANAAQPPPLAPWAREPGSETQKGPSLKEIQEAEAQKAAQVEAQRRATQEQEALAAKEREKVNPAIVPGLPANSTWGSGSPAPSASSPWAKPGAPKVGPAGTTSGPAGTLTPSKKTLAEIQREEEARKLKASKDHHVVQAGAVTGASSFGKRYADFASKTGPPGITTVPVAAGAAIATPSGASGWATVGAGGKVRAPPTGPAAQGRSVSAAAARTPVTQAAKPQTKSVVSPTTKASSVAEAQAAFRTWVKGELSKGLAATHSVDNVATLLLEFDDPELIRLALYEAKSAVDPPYFAQEFTRRKKQADRGIWEPVPGSEAKAASSGGGWSEVAKKSSNQPKESDVVGAGFKVVPRKKGKK